MTPAGATSVTRAFAEPLLARAVRNNADWCHAMCAMHGAPGSFTDQLWMTTATVPRFHPNAVTLVPDASLPQARPSHPWSAKDSFAVLDLTAAGLVPRFDAHWIAASEPEPSLDPPALSWTHVDDAPGLAAWELAWADSPASGLPPLFLPVLLTDRRVTVLRADVRGRTVGGCIAFSSAGVVAITNAFAAGIGHDDLWTDVRRALAVHHPAAPVVGYESDDHLAAALRCGFTTLGRLRVWSTP